MDHQEAMRSKAVEKYLLNEMAVPERDAFEEHFFGCQECASDLQTTAAFLDHAKKELTHRPLPSGPPATRKKSLFALLWSPAFAGPVFACLVLVIGFQNLIVYPRRSEVKPPDAPEILSSVSLIGANSRGGSIPSVSVPKAKPLLLSVDIPMADQYSSYSCDLISPSGAVVWRVPVSRAQARDTVSIRVPAGHWEQGTYTLLVQGDSIPPGDKPTEITRYRFMMNGIN
jgi:hypothetical protein